MIFSQNSEKSNLHNLSPTPKLDHRAGRNFREEKRATFLVSYEFQFCQFFVSEKHGIEGKRRQISTEFPESL